ncbi:helix-turn-helix domain-containing protein [Actinomycetaceae bacterium WB03_NA08]|uniref:Helix-turn-helix domain-containing protein n=1 Tax=Scrofimicrobium canadense TaxID=2652290 RepID=A0A6N7VT80_9ACTO|nr:helix-turn-helix domain-containing protein [Scrofimicrobium canadense]MSS84984.1 helix-turn-helix domain-containing protein [Scrofimicrobium canadense]
MKEENESTSIWLTPQECADHMKVSLRTLQDWRSRKVGPPFHKVGKTVRYHIEEVDEWLLKS